MLLIKMISNGKIRLLELWRKNLFSELSMAEIMKEAKKKTKTWVFNTLKLLVKNEILISTRKANLNIYRLNLNNPLSLQLLQYLETQENLSSPELGIISEIIGKIPVKSCSIIVFGSYAEGKQTKNSDLDICILVEDKRVEKRIKAYVNDVKMDYPMRIDEHYITFDEFVKMLLRDEENLAKQIFIKHRLFYNAEIYYQVVKEAYKNGFRP